MKNLLFLTKYLLYLFGKESSEYNVFCIVKNEVKNLQLTSKKKKVQVIFCSQRYAANKRFSVHHR